MIPPPDLARAQRMMSYERYAYSAAPQAIEAELGVLGAWVTKKSSRVQRQALLGVGAMVIGPLVGCGMHGKGTFFVALVISVIVGSIVLLTVGSTPPVRLDKVQTAGALLRRIHFAPDAAVTLRANLSETVVETRVDTTEIGLFTYGVRTSTTLDEWLWLEGLLANRMAMRLTRATTRVGRRVRRKKAPTIWSHATFIDTVSVCYDPATNPGLAGYGDAVARHLRLAPGAIVEVVSNQPGSLSVRVSSSRPEPLNHPYDLLQLLGQLVALVDPSSAIVWLDRDGFPAYEPSAGELAAVRL